MKIKKKIRFERFAYNWRWRDKYTRSSQWVVIGIQQWYASVDYFCIKFCFFGFDFLIWFEVKYIQYDDNTR